MANVNIMRIQRVKSHANEISNLAAKAELIAVLGKEGIISKENAENGISNMHYLINEQLEYMLPYMK